MWKKGKGHPQPFFLRSELTCKGVEKLFSQIEKKSVQNWFFHNFSSSNCATSMRWNLVQNCILSLRTLFFHDFPWISNTRKSPRVPFSVFPPERGLSTFRVYDVPLIFSFSGTANCYQPLLRTKWFNGLLNQAFIFFLTT